MSDLEKEEILVEEDIAEVENEEEKPELPDEGLSNEEENEVDPEVVERAKKYGHLSKEEWIAQGRDPEQYKTPEEFDKTGKVIEQLYSLKKKVDQRDREIQALVDYQQRTSQREYERARQELEQRLALSKDDMDVEGVARYSQELTRLQDREDNSHAQQLQQSQHAAQSAFIERNAHWFNDRNPDLKQRAIEIDNEIKSVYPNATYEELAHKIETRMQYDYPDRVLGQAKSRGPLASAQSSVNKTAVNKTHVFRNLSQEHKDTYNVYKRINPKITEAEFIQRLKVEGELK